MTRQYLLKNRGQITLNTYGVKKREMSDEQKREYNRIKKAESRTNARVRQYDAEYRAKYYEKNKEKIKKHNKEWYNKNKDKISAKTKVENPFGKCLTRQMFGCSASEMTLEQYRQYEAYIARRRYRKMKGA